MERVGSLHDAGRVTSLRLGRVTFAEVRERSHAEVGGVTLQSLGRVTFAEVRECNHAEVGGCSLWKE